MSLWQWRPDRRLWLCSLVFLPLLIALGFWQLARADDKRALLARWHSDSPQADWGRLAREPLLDGVSVRLQGEYLPAPLWLLDNRTRDGRPGYEVLQLFRPLRGPVVLVNRGWVPAPVDRSQLPTLDTPLGPLELMARVAGYPLPPVLADKDDGVATNWPHRVQRLAADALAPWAARAPAFTLRLQDERQPGAYRVDWIVSLRSPDVHLGYAVQWFSLAGVLLLMTVVASLRKRDECTESYERK